MTMLTITVLSLVAGLPTTSAAERDKLGTIEFPNSGAPRAQEAFIRGVGFLHSFEWEDAAEAFQEAQRVDPGFALAYWGEALSHTGGHHYPPEQDLSKGRDSLSRLAPGAEARAAKAPTPREKAYLKSVELLYGEGDAQERAVAYSNALGEIVEQYPDDLEAKAFYSLSLMRTVRRGEGSTREDMKAGAMALDILRDHPDHPGAAHYIIHAFDDPLHAPVALHAAHRYAKIASAAVHALHMPAHIFVQHGMWDEVVASNTASYDASVTRAERKGLSPTKRSFHALYWLQYGYLQQGRYDEAGRCLEEIRSVAERRDTLKSIKSQLAKMEALQTVETEVWKTMNVDGLLEQIRKNPDEVSPQASGAVLLAAGMSAIRLGDRAAAENAASGMAALRQHSEASSERSLNQIAIMEKELQALIQFERGDQEQAIATLKEATAIAESMPPPSGPPGEADTDPAIKPSHELLGEMLLALDRAAEARAVFESALLRMPNRPRSLLGAARASARSGDEGAARLHYRQLTRIPGAGADLPGLDEARSYLKSATEQP